MSGNSSTHGGQYVPMKLTHTGLPRRLARSIVPPPTCGTTRAGAGSPTWNSAAVDPDGGAPDAEADGLPRALGEGAALGEAAALGVGLGGPSETDG